MNERNRGTNDPFYETNLNAEIEEQHDTIGESPEQTFLEETSAEFTHPITEDEKTTHTNHAYGWIALALSIISLFFIPILFAIAGIIVGVVARNRQSQALGYSAIIIGVISLIVHLFILPFF